MSIDFNQKKINYWALKTHDSDIIRVKPHTWGKREERNTISVCDSCDYLIMVVNIWGRF